MGSFKNALNAINEFVSRESQDREVLGIMVFGSFAKGKLHEDSDVDILLLKNGGAYARRMEEVDGLSFEVYRAPIKVFTPPFHRGERLLFDMFRLQVLRSGKIIYDPWGILDHLRIEACASRIPASYVEKTLERVNAKIRCAEDLLRTGRLRLAESEILSASTDAARALLLNENVPEINTPRLLLPYLRIKNPGFYRIFREIHGLNGLSRSDVESSLTDLLRRLDAISGRIKEDWTLNLIEKAKIEALNAKDCLKHGDYESAMLQIRLSESMLNHPSLMGFLRKSEIGNPEAHSLEYSSINEYIDIMKRIVKARRMIRITP
jgi:predicted nucleotidyltransferase